MSVVLEVSNVSKRYGATHALRDVSFTVVRGSVHAIIGENGAGKSTLIKSLSGLENQDSGTFLLEGQDYRPRNLVESRSHGVSTAFQELGLLPNLSVADNLFLPRLGDGNIATRRRQNEQAATGILAEYGLGHVRPTAEVGRMSLADKQKLEIVRAISHEPRVLLLDEPTAALPDPEWLYEVIKRLKSKYQTLTILYISHRLNEIRDLCERATILRNGQVVDTVEMQDVDDEKVVSLMAGSAETRTEQSIGKRRSGREVGPESLVVDGLYGEKTADVSFSLHQGEILGVAGLQGQGQREVFRMLAGVQRPLRGEIVVDGRPAKLRNPRRALKHGLSFVPEERKVEGLLPGLKTLSNVSISSLSKATTAGFLFGRKERVACLAPSEIVDLSDEYLGKDIDALSGGNQQKAVVARSLMNEAKHLLLYDPSRGVDVGTKASLYDMMRTVTDSGTSILWYSTDLQELVNVCDRILVFYRGSVVAEVRGEEATVEGLMKAITGQGFAATPKRDREVASDESLTGRLPDAATGGGAT